MTKNELVLHKYATDDKAEIQLLTQQVKAFI